ncbi:Crp/Fnr family transcriptional regulator [Halomonas urumqiensis]|uniref:Crp/Fnr family transcriptional regulator n=1 Tax=Halomonas urumqiensis TaxID=1684789 RepID=A0A2N7UP26_9GAMM|nr:Crp/Fnr family transcriptional regulator [Halomonas urumqiensis]PMR82171.1 Crp/Fnr family transcriptional regulator [Halomonas urumqiensis]PTB03053.1 Crp/Fnr family transcriptional regulator [Halomonas urumqiensis]GHE20817.1 Crp/Fnr family transcriptional regulator [Halomonas urumqiensis]
MNSPIHSPLTNHLIDSLPHRDRVSVLADCETVDLAFGKVISEPGDQIQHAYFPLDSFISLITNLSDTERLEVAMVGSEGMLGIPLILGLDESPLLALVQGEGTALRMPVAVFGRHLEQSSALQALLNRYLYVLMHQLTRVAACTHFHQVEARLARWLLMTQDRAHSDQLHLTHEFLAMMLGVRRAGITLAAMALQSRGLIRYHRGDITVLDREGLIEASCGCYSFDRGLYRRIITEADVP